MIHLLHRGWWRASIAPLALFTSVACSKSSPSDMPPAPSASAVASSAFPPALSASAPAAAAGAASSWSGAYTAKVGVVEPPQNAKEKTWTQDPGSAAIGKGTIDLSI